MGTRLGYSECTHDQRHFLLRVCLLYFLGKISNIPEFLFVCFNIPVVEVECSDIPFLKGTNLEYTVKKGLSFHIYPKCYCLFSNIPKGVYRCSNIPFLGGLKSGAGIWNMYARNGILI